MSWATFPLNALLELKFLRRRLIFELKQRFYNELEISVPLGLDLYCPIQFPEAWASFVEIFVELDYAPALAMMPLPDRWLDLGCHAGFFSLYLAFQRARKKLGPDFRAALVDADSRAGSAIEKLIAVNGLEDNFQYHHRLISGKPGQQEFMERGHMASSLNYNQIPAGKKTAATTITADEIVSLMPGPYDLVKVDLEGGEYDFLLSYRPVLESTRHLLVEWHSWQPGGGGEAQVRDLARDNGFELLGEVQSARTVLIADKLQSCGVHLYRQQAR